MKQLNIAMIGSGFMGKAHAVAYSCMPLHFWPAPAMPVRKILVDQNLELAKEGAVHLGFEKYGDDWRAAINDPEIDIVDICTPNNVHREIAIAAAKAGKHIICEKPMALNAQEAKEMYFAAKEAGVKTILGFNYRRVPAITLAKKLIDDGKLGEIHSLRATYLQDWSASPDSPLSWRFKKSVAGSGALGDIGSHIIDMARYLVGEISEVNGCLRTYIHDRPQQIGVMDKLGQKSDSNVDVPRVPVDVDDEASFAVRFENGAIGTLEATRNAWGRNNYITLQIYGSKGSIYFNYEDIGALQVCFADDADDLRSFRTIYTGPMHPNGEWLWPGKASGVGFSEMKAIECHDFFKAIVEDEEASANFEDGYHICVICDAVQKSHENGGVWVKCEYESA